MAYLRENNMKIETTKFIRIFTMIFRGELCMKLVREPSKTNHILMKMKSPNAPSCRLASEGYKAVHFNYSTSKNYSKSWIK